MRLAFWRSGKEKADRAKALVEKAVLEKAAAQKAAAKAAAASYRPTAASPTGDLDMRAERDRVSRNGGSRRLDGCAESPASSAQWRERAKRRLGEKRSGQRVEAGERGSQ